MLIRTNVTNIGDPFILLANNKYYLYATSFDCLGFKVWQSNDLKEFDCLGLCLDLSKSSWAYKDFWAPEVVYYHNKYIMHFTSRDKKSGMLKIGVAISEKAEGPFVDVFDKAMFDFNYPCIDAHVLMTNDDFYLFYAKDCSGNIKENMKISEIYACKLSADLCHVISEPYLISSPYKEYETIVYKNILWNEAPFVLKHHNKYYLTYSANFFASKDYCICLAISHNPLGPYEKLNYPIIKSKEKGNDFSGPGHNAFFIDYDGQLKMVCHIQTNEDKASSNRKVVIIDAYFENEDLNFKF